MNKKIRDTVIKSYREVIEKDYISKDKVKAKIEDLEKMDIYEFETINVIEVLKSLIEKE